MDTSEYLGLFLDEGRDSLRHLSAALLDLERDPGDAGTVAAIFRATHSLKGMSATVGLDAMADLTHRMEDVLTAVRDAGASTTRPLIDALFGCLDALEAMMDAVACGDGAEVDATAVIAGLEAAAATAPASGRRRDPRGRGRSRAPRPRRSCASAPSTWTPSSRWPPTSPSGGRASPRSPPRPAGPTWTPRSSASAAPSTTSRRSWAASA